MNLKIRLVYFHTPLIGAFAMLAFFTHNADYLSLSQLWKPLFYTELFVFTSMMIFGLLLRNICTGNLAATTFCILFFLYGHVHSLFYENIYNSMGWGVGRILIPLWILILGVILWLLVKFYKKADGWSRPVFIFSLMCTLIPASRLAYFEMTHRGFADINLQDEISNSGLAEENNGSEHAWVAQNQISKDSLPDIYFIIPDRYPSNTVLQKYFDFNNEDFSHFLKDKNFHVLDDVSANYLGTTHSLSSTLNLEHHQGLIKQNQGVVPPNKVFDNMTRKNKAVQILKKLGYQYLVIGPWWFATRDSPLADVNYFMRYKTGDVFGISFDEFSVKFLESTMANAFSRLTASITTRQMHRIIANEQFKYFPDVFQKKSPKFVLFHILLPHRPYVFLENGKNPASQGLSSFDEDELFLAQLKYTNVQLKRMINDILEKSQRPPIIILMSDEGWNPQKGPEGKELRGGDWFKSRMGTICAIYAPQLKMPENERGFAPVNTFRMVFNDYFGSSYEMLDNRKYHLISGNDPLDVTEYGENEK